MADWRNGVCGCFNDCSVCIITYLCPCYIFGTTASAVGDSCCVCCCVYFMYPCNFCARTYIRGKIRAKKGIHGSCIGDFCAICCCWKCTLCQEAQETKTMCNCGQAMLRE